METNSQTGPGRPAKVSRRLTPVSIYLPRSMQAVIIARASRHGISRSKLVRTLIGHTGITKPVSYDTSNLVATTFALNERDLRTIDASVEWFGGTRAGYIIAALVQNPSLIVRGKR